MAHRAPWWRVADGLAEIMHRRGLVVEPKARTWPTYEMAAECLRWPLKYTEAMGASRCVS
jgi:hypothetical protein